MPAPEKMYHRTENENGNHNSRCLHCLLTIARDVATEEDLARREGHHLCPEKILAQMRAAEQNAAEKAGPEREQATRESRSRA
jgi:hypothetical protein